MGDVSASVRRFFDAFEANSSGLDVAAIAAQFADVFMNADPAGATPVPKAAFLAALPQRDRLFAAAGVIRPRLVSISETVLGDAYTLVDTQWAAERAAGDPLALSSTFILRRTNGSHVVVFYLNHQDVVQALGGIAAAEAPALTPGSSTQRH